MYHSDYSNYSSSKLRATTNKAFTQELYSIYILVGFGTLKKGSDCKLRPCKRICLGIINLYFQ